MVSPASEFLTLGTDPLGTKQRVMALAQALSLPALFSRCTPHAKTSKHISLNSKMEVPLVFPPRIRPTLRWSIPTMPQKVFAIAAKWMPLIWAPQTLCGTLLARHFLGNCYGQRLTVQQVPRLRTQQQLPGADNNGTTTSVTNVSATTGS